MQDTDSILEARKYDRVWATSDYRASPSPGERILDRALREMGLVSEFNSLILPFSMADFGCGDGRALNQLVAYGVQCIGIDCSAVAGQFVKAPFFKESLWELRNLQVDYGVCCDVMEHIPTDRVNATLTSIKWALRKSCFFQIAMFTDHFGPAIIGSPLHLTVKPAEWWVDQFDKINWKIKMVETDTKSYGAEYPYLLIHAVRN